ncbi:DNA cytosine methyltransferase [Glaciecola sp. KUL10]|uniref:DNA cytosine methyltransferase n=1 Tax=Glaciecola sp. (strain KUL10) TaxID=2161813 RepID=UPI000D784278|nr:DNA cytosine methyltransferase [Glaciecola sp. KUL10]GBL02959.1 C-5 cytosine-specific DNA methylase [Glaciecola sp. KUL10]
MNRLQNGLFRELIVDNFAGGGGASQGIYEATGMHVDIAINHDQDAIDMHEINHPGTKHFCESVWDVNPKEIVNGQPVSIAWFSPDCKHFSKAKGSKPVNKSIRGLAWIALRWAAVVKPRVIMLENVEEFKTWGPVLENGYPCPKGKGKTFASFIKQLKKQGYEVEFKELVSSDYGVPTKRKRFFMIARRDGKKIVWPKATHGDPKSKGFAAKRLKPNRTAAECIDWSIPVTSIFNRKKALVENTMSRIAKGVFRYVINNPEPFVVENCAPFITEHANSSNQRNMPINEPLRTITSTPKGGSFALVSPVLTKYYGAKNEHEFRGHGVEQPLHTLTTSNRYGLVLAFLSKYYTGVVGDSLENPLPTVTAIDHNALVASHLIKLRNGEIGTSLNEPLHTITAGGNHHGIVNAFLLKYYGNEKDGCSITSPMPTITTKDRLGLVMVKGEPYQIADIGMRMLQPKELFKAQGFPDSYVIDKDKQGKPISKAKQVARCGNSVPPMFAKVLVEANLPELALHNIQVSRSRAA